MNQMLLLMLLSAAAVTALFGALAIFLRLIVRELEHVGGPATRLFTPAHYLGKIRLGLRAIEVETGHLVPQVTTLNASLTSIRDGLKAIDTNLSGVIAAVQRQESR